MSTTIKTDDGIRLNVRIEGRKDGPPLLLANSLGTDLSMWDEQMETFRAVFQVARYDLRGHGGSDVPAGDYSVAQLGRDALAIAKAQGWDRFAFCGLSLGGAIGYWLATHASERLARLVVANGGAYAGGAQVWGERIKQVAAGGVGAVADGVVSRWFTPRFTAAQPATIQRIANMVRNTSPVGYSGCCAALRDMDLRPEISRIATPTLIIAGQHDMGPPPAALQAVAAAIPGARCLVLDAAHLSNIEAHAAFTQAVVEFLT